MIWSLVILLRKLNGNMFWKIEKNELVKKPEVNRCACCGIIELGAKKNAFVNASGIIGKCNKCEESGCNRECKRIKQFLNSDETGAEKRFDKRVQSFKKDNKPVYKHHFWWFVHNCVAHPLIGMMPNKSTFEFHDWTSKKINGK